MAAVPPITCPSCTKKFKTKADVRGKRIRCPFCTESFIVPVDDPPEADEEDGGYAVAGAKAEAKGDTLEPLAVDAAMAATAAAANSEAEEGDDPYAVTHLDLAPRCPNCANEMPSAEAVVCLICGYNTLTREWGKTEKLIGVSGGRHFLHLLPGIIVLLLLLTCIIERMVYSIYWPFMVAGSWAEFSDHESMRMWGTMISLACIFGMGNFCYRRFFVKPRPDEVKVEE